MSNIPVADSLRLAQRLRMNIDRLRRLARSSGAITGLSRPQEAVLSTLQRIGPLTTADLARRELLRPQTMGGIVNELLQQGFVTKSPDLSDGRREFVAITVEGVQTMDLVNQIRDRDLAALLNTQLDDRQHAVVQEALNILESLGADGS